MNLPYVNVLGWFVCIFPARIKWYIFYVKVFPTWIFWDVLYGSSLLESYIIFVWILLYGILCDFLCAFTFFLLPFSS